MLRLVQAALGAAILALAAAGHVAAGDRPADGPDAVFTTAEDLAGRLVAQVRVNGQGPFPFIIDTGANRTAITRALVDKLQLPVEAYGRVEGVTGAQDMAFARIAALEAGAHRTDDVLAPVIESRVTSGAMGLLGVDGLGRRRLELDLETGEARITASQRRRPPRGAIVAPGYTRFGGLFVVRGTIDERIRVNVILDTGAERTLRNRVLARALGRRWLPLGQASIARVSGATGALARGDIGYLPPITLGGVAIADATMIVGDFHVFSVWGMAEEPTLLLGMDVLGNARKLAIDYGRRELHLTP
jgi:predicted aspartyl protease